MEFRAPSVSYALGLQDRLKSQEAILKQLHDAATNEEKSQLLEEYFNNSNASYKPRRASQANSHMNSHQDRADPRAAANVEVDDSSEDEVTELLNETTVGEDGRIYFYGRTSHYHLHPAQICESGAAERGLSEAIRYRSAIHKDPSPGTSPQTDWGSIFTTDISQELVSDLIHSGPYVTVFLLNCTLAQAARFSDRQDASDLSAYFAKKALNELAEEIDRGSSIPTLQGLLILSARECAAGRTSQGWLFSGMAFRMMRDLGIHIHPKSLSHLEGQFSLEDLALRQQIFWSCYTWDKTMSLCLGRAPTIHETMPVPSPETWLDEEPENETWSPHFRSSIPSDVGCISQRSYTNSRFSAYCTLCIIIDDVLDTLYSRPHHAGSHLNGYLDRIMGKLEDWSKELPSHLYIAKNDRIISCPPLHILLLNLLYHATIILLCRPYRTQDSSARATATKAAEMIDRLLTLHVRRFGFRVLTYLETYTVFVGATINILDLKQCEGEEAEAANARLAFSMEVLRNAHSTPSTLKCVEIIEQCLRNDNQATSKVHSEERRNGGSKTPHSLGSPQTSNHEPRQQQRAPQLAVPPSLPVNSRPSFLAPHAQYQNPVNSTAIYESNQLGTDPNETILSNESPPMQTNEGFPVDTPLRWLPDNVRDDCTWMMMGMDFAYPQDILRN
ncbi:hypothetical protein N7474_011181 [Penicillium riverlandense]|uniref:uncharacterized protein n=1 Tax=Penicillium riverlandense TaxID=1903569 RepID=UPI0025490DAE|nr:uncharacterized protein N7474_011181 [Penicillium riverlandense]KAJ5805294.1 hypothetical protein N7474_011181 [Penicillium riverlandense]